VSIIPDPDRLKRAREPAQPSTLHQHGQSQADEISQGRFAATGAPTVVGSTPIPKYPELPSGPWSGNDPVPQEPPLGVDINSMPEFGQSPTGASISQPVATGGPPDAPSRNEKPTLMSERGGPPSSSDDGGSDDAA
jgi:hypothetical protein